MHARRRRHLCDQHAFQFECCCQEQAFFLCLSSLNYTIFPGLITVPSDSTPTRDPDPILNAGDVRDWAKFCLLIRSSYGTDT